MHVALHVAHASIICVYSYAHTMYAWLLTARDDWILVVYIVMLITLHQMWQEQWWTDRLPRICTALVQEAVSFSLSVYHHSHCLNQLHHQTWLQRSSNTEVGVDIQSLSTYMLCVHLSSNIMFYLQCNYVCSMSNCLLTGWQPYSRCYQTKTRR